MLYRIKVVTPMSLLDNFKSMDDVRAYAESLKNSLTEEDYELALYLLGLLDNRGISEIVSINGDTIKIDKSIVPMIKDLNNRGISTLACCSGLQEEHPEERFKPKSGYLSIAYNETLLEKLQKEIVDNIIEIEKSDCYLKSSIRICIKSNEDSVLKEKWILIWDILKKILKE